jgi:hypothetical protein
MFVCYVCCVLSGIGLCGELITLQRGVLPTVARQETSCDEKAIKKRAEPRGNACSKNST